MRLKAGPWGPGAAWLGAQPAHPGGGLNERTQARARLFTLHGGCTAHPDPAHMTSLASALPGRPVH